MGLIWDCLDFGCEVFLLLDWDGFMVVLAHWLVGNFNGGYLIGIDISVVFDDGTQVVVNLVV